MLEYNIIGDIAGNYIDLMKLLDQMPKNAVPLSVGDMCDRGSNSKEVLDFFMENGEAILGNHSHMMLTTLNKPIGTPEEYYQDTARGNYSVSYDSCLTQLAAYNMWMNNGGYETLQSFGIERDKTLYQIWDVMQEVNRNCQQVPIKYRHWIANLPLYRDIGNLIVTHAPIEYTLEKSLNLTNLRGCIFWNRYDPPPLKGKIQIFGHNWHYEEFKKKNEIYAMCIDGNGDQELIGLHYPSMTVYRQPFTKVEKDVELTNGVIQ